MADQSRNIKNYDNPLFKALTRLLSGPIVDRRKQNPRQLKRWQLNKYQFTSAGGLSFKKASYDPFNNLRSSAYQNINRAERYIDFDQMEYMPEIASALDIYADEMTVSSPLQKILQINCPNEEIKEVLHQLFYNVLNIEFNIFGWCRSMCKFGDYFLYLDIDDDLGVQSVIGLPPQEIERLEGEDKTNPNYVQFQWNSGGLTFENWQVAQFRILGNDKYAPYGSSVLEASLRIWRQLTLLEDAMMAYRVVRSPERRVFYVDVGGIPEKEIEQHMQRIVTQMKRNQVIDATSGRVDLRYNPMSIDEDYFIPVRGGASNTRVESLPGGTYTGDVDDVKYLRDKLFSALKVPPSYLTQAEEGGEEKNNSRSKGCSFCQNYSKITTKCCCRVRKRLLLFIFILWATKEKIYYLSSSISIVHPKSQNFKSLSTGEQSLRLLVLQLKDTSASAGSAKTFSIFPMKRSSEINAKCFMIRSLKPHLKELLKKELLKKAGKSLAILVAKKNLAEKKRLVAKKVARKKKKHYWLSLVREMICNGAHKNPRLVRPVDQMAKKYMPEKHDSREDAGRKKNMMGKVNMEKASNTQRNVLPGLEGFKQLYKGINEEQETNYINEEKEENKVLANSIEIRKIIENLQKRDTKENDKSLSIIRKGILLSCMKLLCWS